MPERACVTNLRYRARRRLRRAPVVAPPSSPTCWDRTDIVATSTAPAASPRAPPSTPSVCARRSPFPHRRCRSWQSPFVRRSNRNQRRAIVRPARLVRLGLLRPGRTAERAVVYDCRSFRLVKTGSRLAGGRARERVRCTTARRTSS